MQYCMQDYSNQGIQTNTQTFREPNYNNQAENHMQSVTNSSEEYNPQRMTTKNYDFLVEEEGVAPLHNDHRWQLFGEKLSLGFALREALTYMRDTRLRLKQVCRGQEKLIESAVPYKSSHLRLRGATLPELMESIREEKDELMTLSLCLEAQGGKLGRMYQKEAQKGKSLEQQLKHQKSLMQ